jgi:hypothetical protein
MISPIAFVTLLNQHATLPLPGIQPLMDENRNEIEEKVGKFVY